MGSPPSAWPAGGLDATGAPLEEDGLFSAEAAEVPSDMVADALRWWCLWEKSDVGEWMPVILEG